MAAQGLTGGNEDELSFHRRWLTLTDAVDAARIGDCWSVKSAHLLPVTFQGSPTRRPTDAPPKHDAVSPSHQMAEASEATKQAPPNITGSKKLCFSIVNSIPPIVVSPGGRMRTIKLPRLPI